jgi:hypothetical protein
MFQKSSSLAGANGEARQELSVTADYPASIESTARAQAPQERIPPIGTVAPTKNSRTPKQIDAQQRADADARRNRTAGTVAAEAPPPADKVRALPKAGGDEPVFLDAALGYAARRLHVFPCHPRSKAPAVAHGFYAATTNPETIRRLWRIPNRNVAVRTGVVSGVWVVDVDGDRGEASIRRLEAEHGLLPPTREVISGGGGRHLWLRYTGPIPSSVGHIAPGVDVRADGGYIIAPPSLHDETGRPYCWSVDAVDDLAIAPEWLVTLARKRPQPAIPERAVARIYPDGRPGAYGAAALERECAALAAVAPGGRNHALNRAAFCLFQLVAGGELDRHTVGERLIEACHRNGLVADDGLPSVLATARSGARAGLQHPRSRGGAA